MSWSSPIGGSAKGRHSGNFSDSMYSPQHKGKNKGKYGFGHYDQSHGKGGLGPSYVAWEVPRPVPGDISTLSSPTSSLRQDSMLERRELGILQSESRSARLSNVELSLSRLLDQNEYLIIFEEVDCIATI